MKTQPKKIAIVSVGPIGPGRPARAACLNILSQYFSITVYSLVKHDPKVMHNRFNSRSLSIRTPFLRLDLLRLSMMIVFDTCRQKIDLLHAVGAFPAGWICTRLAKVLKVGCVISLHGQEVANLPSIDFGDLRSRKKKRITALVCENATVLTTLTRFQAAGLPKVGISSAKAIILPLGVDLARFPFTQKQLRPPYIFLHVGYSHPVKDIEMLLETFKIISDNVDSRLVIVGRNHVNGPTEKAVNRLMLSNRVECVEHVQSEDLRAFHARAHFLLHTSRYESQGVVINEAMASGVVVCATSVGLAADLGDEYCITAKVGDPRDLAECVLRTLADREKYEALRARAYEWCAAHDVHWTASKHRKIYEDAIG